MRTKFFTIVALSTLTIFTAGVTSCSKSNNNPGGSLSATIGSTSFSPSQSISVYYQSQQDWDIAGFTVKGTDSTGLDVNIPGPFKLNTTLDNDLGGIGITYFASGGKIYFTGLGYGHAALTVTSLDSAGHKIAGKFTATLYNQSNNNDSLMVTNGQFNTTYLVQ